MQKANRAKVVLIRPHMLIPKYSFTGLTVPPLGLAYVAAALQQKGHEVSLIDSVGEAVEQNFPHHEGYILHGLTTQQILSRIPEDCDFIGVSCMFSHEFPVYCALIQAIKERFPKATLLAGGEHVTALPEETFRQCPGLDIAVLGEGEETISEIVSSAGSDEELARIPGLVWRDRHGVLRFSSRRERVRDIDSLPLPAWELVPLQNYWKYGMGLGVNRGRSMPMLATRGCPYQCTFCSNPVMWTTRWVARKPEAVIREMTLYAEKYGAVNFDFYDLTAIVKKDWILNFCRLILDGNLRCSYQLPSGTRSEAIDQEVAGLLFASGCRNMTYAPESGSADTLKRIKKHIKVDAMIDSMRACYEKKLSIKANIIVGFPGDTYRDLWNTYRFILRMALIGVQDVTIQPFSAYPGSELFDRLRKENRIPILDDQYYYALADYSDLSKAISWSEHLSNRSLLWFRTIGMLSFYVLGYLVRPWRFFRVAYNLLRGRQESRMERALSDIFQRRYVLAGDEAPPSKLATAVQSTLKPPYI